VFVFVVDDDLVVVDDNVGPIAPDLLTADITLLVVVVVVVLVVF